MTPHYADDWLTVYAGDAREVLPELASDSVDCIVTSPPYWGLRDYGTATWSGGDELHEHRGVIEHAGKHGSEKQASKRGSTLVYSGDCACGATRIDSQLGLEATPEEYVANLVAVFRELKRVLKPSGTCWLNLGDSYASDTKGVNNNGQGASTIGYRADGSYSLGPDGSPYLNELSKQQQVGRRVHHGLKPKDLVGIPWRVAFALQADGWYLRSDIIWAKPNPMPESVTDRPTKAHEYLFLLTKSPRYYFDQEAVRESGTGRETFFPATPQLKALTDSGVRNDGDSVNLTPAITRNLRSVWTIATRPYPGAHFAVFPPELPERCIKAGSSERGVCPECGAPWERTTEMGGVLSTGGSATGARAKNMAIVSPLGQDPERSAYNTGAFTEREHVTTGWLPSCGHPSKPVPATILDPFAGSGTVGLVANRLSRRAILIDLNPAYLEQQMQRNAQVPVGL